ncbi:hypothetical protein EAF00_007185 [Botryotinia globosa]|nr:hypothetical protein EAF00_007185 [Botryotinia globosa]
MRTSSHNAQQSLIELGVDPFDLSATLESDHKYNFFKHANAREKITVPGSTRKYWPPKNFEKRETGSTTVANSLIYRTGTELGSDLKVDSKVAANYFGFSAEASAGYEYSTNLKATKDEFIDAAAKLPAWKTISKDLKDFDDVTSIYNSFAKFYARYGSHLIQQAYMGTQYQLKVEQNESTEEKMEEFSTNIKAEYQGAIGASVSFDVKYSESYKHYTSQRQSNCNVLGGDAGKTGTLAHLSPDDADAYNAAFKEWQESREEGSTDAPLHIRVMEIGSFLKDSYVKSQLAVADRLSSAWSYFKDVCTFQGQIFAEFIYKGDATKLEITSLPGLEIRVTGIDNIAVTQTKANSVELTSNDSSFTWGYLNVTIVVPDRPVQLLFTKVLGSSSMTTGFLQLNRTGKDTFRTNYKLSDASQNVKSFRDAHKF